MKKDVKIAISGRSGCGNTTVSKMIADTLDLSFINFTFRNLASERGIDLKTVLALAENDDSWDKEVDFRQVKMARESGGCVLGSRLAIWMLEEADLKVYLYASSQIRAQRICKREGGCMEEITAFTTMRDKMDHDRYLKFYNIDTNDYSIADIVIDVDTLAPQEIVDRIIAAIP